MKPSIKGESKKGIFFTEEGNSKFPKNVMCGSGGSLPLTLDPRPSTPSSHDIPKANFKAGKEGQ
jgi:hypothetical protein